MVNQTKKIKLLDLNLWVWIVTIIAAVGVALLINFVFAPMANTTTDYKHNLNYSSKESDYNEIQKANINIGDYVQFGHYDRNNNQSDGKETLYWKVLDVNDDSALIISFYAIEAKSFGNGSTSWGQSTLRQWLNGTFMEETFSEEEQKSILKTKVTSEKTPICASGKTEIIEDYIYLLSGQEASKYYEKDEERKVIGSDHAEANGLYVSSTGYCRWWLRDAGMTDSMASVINGDGVVDYYGMDVTASTYGVVPVMWVKTAALKIADPELMKDVVVAADSKAESDKISKESMDTDTATYISSNPLISDDTHLVIDEGTAIISYEYSGNNITGCICYIEVGSPELATAAAEVINSGEDIDDYEYEVLGAVAYEGYVGIIFGSDAWEGFDVSNLQMAIDSGTFTMLK